jgi:orotidine-5'-phosphate decarboxylase
VAAVKPQSAFFERHASSGVAVLESIIRQLRQSGTVVILDVKRGDIGSTAAAYADAYLDPASPLAADAVTASPYLGVGAAASDDRFRARRGLRCVRLARTSNPEGSALQRAVTASGRTVAQAVVEEISQVNQGVEPMGDIGVVVGATIGSDADEPVLDLDGMGVRSWLPASVPRAAGRMISPDLRVGHWPGPRRVLQGDPRHGPSVTDLRAAADRVLADLRHNL